MVHIYTGGGKGKTSAAIGLTIRAKGAGLSCLFVHFFKKPARSEDRMLAKLGIKAASIQIQHPYFAGAKAFSQKKDEYRKELNAVMSDWDFSLYNVIVLDEILNAFDLELITVSEIRDFVRKYGDKEIILTGRTKRLADIKDLADYITEMRKIKHPFDNGVIAREGIEY